MRITNLGLLASSAVAAIVAAAPVPAIAQAQTFSFDIPAQSLDASLRAFAHASRQQILFDGDLVKGKSAPALKGTFSADAAINRLLEGSGLVAKRTNGRSWVVSRAQAQVTDAAGPGIGVAVPVSGTVIDERTGANLRGALVQIEETGQKTSTDDLGTFQFPSIKPGTYTLTISYLGYRDVVTELRIEPGRRFGGTFAMVGGDDKQTIVVYGYRSARAQSLNQERTAENVQTVVSSDLLGDFTGTTISESLRRAPAVTFDRDPNTGEGTNILIRGLEPDLNTVKLNGIELPEGRGTGRSASLSNILTESISEVTIHKTLLPNQDSSGTGGLVEIKTKTPLDRPRRYASFTLEGAKRGNGFNDEFLAAGTLSGRFGANDQFGLSASVQYRTRKLKRIGYESNLIFGQYLPLDNAGRPITSPSFFIDPRTPFPFEPGADEVYPDSITITRADQETKNLGITLSAGWEIAEHTNLFMDFQRLDQEDTLYSLNWSLVASLGYLRQPVQSLGGEERGALTWLGQRIAVNPIVSYQPDSKSLTDVYSFRGESEFGKFHLNYLAGYAKGTTTQNLYGLRSTAANLQFGPDHLLPEAIHPVEGRIISPFPLRRPGDDSFIEPLFSEAGFDLLNSPESYPFQSAIHTLNIGRNERYNGEFSARFQAEGEYLKYLEVGGFYKQSDFTNARQFFQERVPINSLTLADLGFDFSEENLEDIGIETRISLLDKDDVVDFLTRQAPSLEGTLLLLLPDPFDPRERDKLTGEKELAAYVQGALQFGRLDVVGGVRMTRVAVDATNLVGPRIFDENFQQDIEFFAANSGLVSEKATQTDYLPRVLANFRWNDNLVARAGYYLTVARPQISLLSQTANVTLHLAPFFGPTFNQPQLSVSKGNPDLKPARTHNFDLSVEHYDKSVGVVKVGAFYKRINNLLESNVQTGEGALADVVGVLPNDPRFQDVLNNPGNYAISVTLPQNNPDPAEIWGIETAVEKQFTFLPGIWRGFGVFANYTYTDSSKNQPGNWLRLNFSDEGVFQGSEIVNFVVPGVRFNGQARHSGTFGVTYNQYGIDANLAYTFQGRRQTGFARHNLHRFEEAFGTLDFRGEYRFDRGPGSYRVFVEATDLLRGPRDAAIRSTQGADDEDTPKYHLGGRYFGGRQFRLGVNVTF